MIIFRVTTGRSWLKFPTVKDGAITNPINFAHQTAESSFLQTSMHQRFGRNVDVVEVERDQESNTSDPITSKALEGKAREREDTEKV